MTDNGNRPTGQTLLEGPCEAVLDACGDLPGAPGDACGFYVDGLRCLSHLVLTLEGATTQPLGTSLREAHTLLLMELATPALRPVHGPRIAQGDLHLFRTAFLWRGALYQHLRVSHHGREPVRVELGLHVDADFARPHDVDAHGDGRSAVQRLPVECLGAQLRLAARLSQGRVARTRITLRPAPGHWEEDTARWALDLPPQGEFHLYLEVRGHLGDESPAAPAMSLPLDYETAYRANVQARVAWREARTRVEVADDRLQGWLAASLADVALLNAACPVHEALRTARMMLWLDPSLAQAALSQAMAASPGEAVHGAMAVALAAACYRRTGDLEAVETMWPWLRASLDRIDEALGARGWLIGTQDAQDAPVYWHAEGRPADGPLALCAVQAHVYEARLRGAELATALGNTAFAQHLRAQARAWRERFQVHYWLEELGCFALALDARGQPLRLASVHTVHPLTAGLATPDQVASVVERLARPDLNTGFGLRTLASGQPGFNALAPLQGAVWPQDAAVAAIGLARHGHADAAVDLFNAMADAASGFPGQRLPTCFAGYTRREGEGPVRQPGARSPHAGAAAAALGLLQACLGLEVDAVHRRVTLHAPRLPASMPWLRLQGLRVGSACVDLCLERAASSVGVRVTRQEGQVQVQVCVEAPVTGSGP